MIVLGIDPGLTRCGFGLISTKGPRELSFLDVGVFTSKPDLALEKRLGQIADEINLLIDESKPDVIALERVFAQANLASVMGVAQISGIILYQAHLKGVEVAWHTPTQVKAAVTGSGRANKTQVGNMVAKILGLPEIPKPADAADALAIAITHAWNSNAVPSSSELLTPAQQKWLTAVAQAKSKGK